MAALAKSGGFGTSKLRIVALLAGVVILVSYAFASDAAPRTAEEIGLAFCDARITGDMVPVQSLLTPDLTAAITVAEARNAAIQAAAPEEKPPLGDGIPWQSFQDYAPNCVVAKVAQANGATQVDLAYSFPDQPEADWTDTLILSTTDGHLLIDDLRYGSGGDTLKSVLVTAFDL